MLMSGLMDNTDANITVAVTGSSGPVGAALVARLDADEQVGRIIGVDTTEPDMPAAKLELRTMDVRDAVLSSAFAGADVVVHTDRLTVADPDQQAQYSAMVNGTQSVLAAVAQAGVGRYVHVSDWTVYGAHPDTPEPVSEDAPLRANPDYAPGYYHQLAEEHVAAFAGEHPQVDVAVLRPAAVFGSSADHTLARHFAAPVVLADINAEEAFQVLGVDDLAAALHLAVTGAVTGVANVSVPGALSADDVATMTGSRVLRLPAGVLDAAVGWLWSRGWWSYPPAFLRVLRHPVVLSSEKLVSNGWVPVHDQRRVLREFAAANAETWQVGPSAVRRKTLGFGALAALATFLVARRLFRR